MSNASTKTMLAGYSQTRPPETFFAGLFKLKTFRSKSVEIDIQREDEDVAVGITDLSQKGRTVVLDQYTNKEFTPPIIDENFALNSYDMLKRQFGDDPFKSPAFLASAATQTFRNMRHLEARARRAYELQASQVMQTGTATLINNAGTEIYTIDYSPKVAHFPTASIKWGEANDTPVADVIGLTEVIRNNGLADPTRLIFGSTAWALWIEEIRANYDTARINQGAINPLRVVAGAQYRGTLELGNYSFDMWTYNARYKHQSSGTKTPYMDPGKVIAMSPDMRLDAAFGEIPRLVPPDSRLSPFIPKRRITGGGMDMFVDGEVLNSGKNVEITVASRGLYIPVAIDQYGCLDTQL